jgi:hypothetical protein
MLILTSWFRRTKLYYGVWLIDWRRRMPYVDSQVVWLLGSTPIAALRNVNVDG